jgi:hypothetical protein
LAPPKFGKGDNYELIGGLPLQLGQSGGKGRLLCGAQDFGLIDDPSGQANLAYRRFRHSPPVGRLLDVAGCDWRGQRQQRQPEDGKEARHLSPWC